MEKLELNFRKATKEDINTLHNLDLKANDFPERIEFFRKILTNSMKNVKAYFACFGPKEIAFICINAVKKAEIIRMGVLPRYQKRGVGKELLFTTENHLKEKLEGELKTISVLVPECHCNPAHPDDVSRFLLSAGFEAKEVKSRKFNLYGEFWDGFLFIKEVK